MILIFIFVSVLLSCVPFLHSATNHNISISTCPQNFSCPYLAPFKYPFYNVTNTKCGLIEVNCTSNGTQMLFGGHSYEIVSKVVSESLVMIRNTTFGRLLHDKSCKALMYNFTSPSPLLYSISILPFITLYKCTNNPIYDTEMKTYFHQSNYKSYKKCKDHNFYYNYSISGTTVPSDLPPTCQVIRLPVKFRGPGDRELPDETNVFSLLDSVFSIKFRLSKACDECHKQDGHCDARDGQITCLDAKKAEKPHRKMTLVLVLAGAAFIIVLFFVIFIIWRHYKRNPLSYLPSKDSSANVEDGSHFHGVSVFSYTELEDATRNFDPSQELGNGGFGAVC